MLAERMGFNAEDYRLTADVEHQLPFSSDMQRMTTVVAVDEVTRRVYTNGAPEVLLGMCTRVQRGDGVVEDLSDAEKHSLYERVLTPMTADSLRTLVLAYKDIPADISLTQITSAELDRDALESDLIL
jgi:magnesium-transporting ATPase (P-type)